MGKSYEEIIEVETGYSPLTINQKGETQLEKKLRLAKSSGVERISFCCLTDSAAKRSGK